MHWLEILCLGMVWIIGYKFNGKMGTLIALLLVMWLANRNKWMGLLAALGLMWKEYQVMHEHMDNMNMPVADDKPEEKPEGVDRENIKAAVMSKNSKTIPVDSSVKYSEDVQPNDTAQGFALLHG